MRFNRICCPCYLVNYGRNKKMFHFKAVHSGTFSERKIGKWTEIGFKSVENVISPLFAEKIFLSVQSRWGRQRSEKKPLARKLHSSHSFFLRANDDNILLYTRKFTFKGFSLLNTRNAFPWNFPIHKCVAVFSVLLLFFCAYFPQAKKTWQNLCLANVE